MEISIVEMRNFIRLCLLFFVHNVKIVSVFVQNQGKSCRTSLIDHFQILRKSRTLREPYESLWINRPLRSFGSNQVDFGGISLPSSAICISSSMEVGNMAKATPPVSSAIA